MHQRQTIKEQLCLHCKENQVETELRFLTSHQKSNMDKLPLLLREPR